MLHVTKFPPALAEVNLVYLGSLNKIQSGIKLGVSVLRKIENQVHQFLLVPSLGYRCIMTAT